MAEEIFDELEDMKDDTGNISLDIRLKIETVRVLDNFAKRAHVPLQHFIMDILIEWIEINRSKMISRK